MCCSGIEWEPEELPDGECPVCGEETRGGEAYRQCHYSPVVCDECNWAPCDGSC
jgi:hypothetical protein